MTYINFIRAGWVSPSEFWKMTPDEIWWLYEAKTKTGNEPTRTDWAELYKLFKG